MDEGIGARGGRHGRRHGDRQFRVNHCQIRDEVVADGAELGLGLAIIENCVFADLGAGTGRCRDQNGGNSSSRHFIEAEVIPKVAPVFQKNSHHLGHIQRAAPA